ncbi:hypothetical protein T484DRAFT_1847471 [Baffinella frigidus]|nr:hypothetical protein T484DRAFT_1847471 [Cryptophyta sp. CCMP2293]
MRDPTALASGLLLLSIAVALPLCGGADRGRSPSTAAFGAHAPTSSVLDAEAASCTVREMIRRISQSPRAGEPSGDAPAGPQAAGERREPRRCVELRGGAGEAYNPLDPGHAPGHDPAGIPAIQVVDVWGAELGQMEGGLGGGMDTRCAWPARLHTP